MNLTTPVSSGSNECQRLDVPPEHVHTVTVARYHAMLRAGTLADDRPIELLEGWLAATFNDSEPDIAVIRGDTSELLDRHAGPSEIALLIEVADTSLERDRTWKKRI